MNVDVEVDVVVAPKLLPANPSNCANHFWQFSVPFLLAQKLKVFCDVIAFAPAVSLIKFKRLTKKKTPSRLPTKRALFNFRVLHSIHAPKLGQHTHTSTHAYTCVPELCFLARFYQEFGKIPDMLFVDKICAFGAKYFWATFVTFI